MCKLRDNAHYAARANMLCEKHFTRLLDGGKGKAKDNPLINEPRLKTVAVEAVFEACDKMRAIKMGAFGTRCHVPDVLHDPLAASRLGKHKVNQLSVLKSSVIVGD